MSEVWHRVTSINYAAPVDEFDNPCGIGTVGIIHAKYEVLKHTPKGVLLDVGFGRSRLVLNEARRQWASPTFEQAKEKFIRRKQAHIRILKAQIRCAEEALLRLKDFKPV